MNRFKILKDFNYDVCDVTKIIKIINKKFYIKITISIIKEYLNAYIKCFYSKNNDEASYIT